MLSGCIPSHLNDIDGLEMFKGRCDVQIYPLKGYLLGENRFACKVIET